MTFSKKQITKYGNILLTSKSQEEVNDALEKINLWRANHLYPLSEMKNHLAELCNSNSITPHLISQRLKRMSSIEYKLDLNENMGLGGMQDIGGYRAVLNKDSELKQLKDLLINETTPHILEKISDYIEYPKPSGYRSIHFIYKYQSNDPTYDGLKLELQIRTKLQHNWATAVETAGLITKTSLKSSQGPDEWLEFFKVVSSLFAIKEKLPVLEAHREKTMKELMVECYQFCQKYNIIDTLKALRVSINLIEKENLEGDYYLIHINIKEGTVEVTVFDKDSFTEATELYNRKEKLIEETKDAVVLVSASSIKELRQAYPSYFLDTSEFLNAIETINKNCKIRKYL